MTPLPALDQARQAVAALVERFERNLDAYSRADYKETEARLEQLVQLMSAGCRFPSGPYMTPANRVLPLPLDGASHMG
jgi:hypothetical protein